MDSILIAGASGFLGRNLVPILLKKKFKLIIFSTGNSTFKISRIKEYRKKIIFVNSKNLLSTINKHRIVMFINLQVSFSYFHNLKSLSEMIDANITTPIKIAEMCSEKKYFKRLISPSSYFLYGKGTKDYYPSNVFAGTKKSFSDLAESLAVNKGFIFDEVVVYDTFGEGDPRQKIVSIINNAINDNTIIKLSPGKQIIDLSHIESIAQGFFNLIVNKDNGNIGTKRQFFASTGNRMTLRDLAKKIVKIKGKKFHAEWGAFNYRKGEIMKPIIPNKKWNICKREKLDKRLKKYLI